MKLIAKVQNIILILKLLILLQNCTLNIQTFFIVFNKYQNSLMLSRFLFFYCFFAQYLKDKLHLQLWLSIKQLNPFLMVRVMLKSYWYFLDIFSLLLLRFLQMIQLQLLQSIKIAVFWSPLFCFIILHYQLLRINCKSYNINIFKLLKSYHEAILVFYDLMYLNFVQKQILYQFVPAYMQIIQNLKPVPQKKSIKEQLNYVKKVFKRKHPNSTDVTLKYSRIIPSLWVSHRYKGKANHTHIEQFLLTKSQAKNPKTIDRIYSQLYDRVHPDYENIIQFALEKAYDRKLDKTFTWKSIDKMYKLNNNKLMFYCCEDKHQGKYSYGFSIFNIDLANVEFDSAFIKTKKEYLEDQYEDYLDFLDQYYPITDKNQKASNNKQVKKQQESSLPDCKQKLFKILNKNLRPYEKKIKKMLDNYYDLEKQYQRGNHFQQNQLDNLDEQIYQFQKRLQNFKSTVKEIRIEMQEKGNQFLKGNYKKALIAEKQLDSKLPIIARKGRIINALSKNDIIILQGETGSGKSTQLPQFLCEYFNLFDDAKSLPVLITQPRKLAVKALAERVAFELEEKVGNFVDFVDSDMKIQNEQAKIVFKLDRIALDDLIQDEALSNYSCLVLDQAHQRTINIDVIVGLVSKLFLKMNAKRNFKVIITSASMDVKLFQNYFKEYGGNLRIKTIKVPGRMYQVKMQYKDYHHLKTPMSKIQKVIEQEIIVNGRIKKQLQGNILIFCISVQDINNLVDKYSKRLDQQIFKVFPLHGKLQPEQQGQIFKKIKQFKVIFATRMAETAITIDGVTVVVDPGEDMKKIFDQNNKISSMRLMKISQSTAKQRAGRAGRTLKGYCFRLYSERYLQGCPLNQTPQIDNQSLEIVVLRLKQLKLKNISKFQFLSPPSPDALRVSQRLLTMIGCLNDENQLNSIGRLLVKIPIQPFLSRTIVQSLIYQQILKENYAQEQLLTRFKTADIKKMKTQPLSQSIIQILCMVVNSETLFYSVPQTRQQTDLVKFEEFSDERGDFFYLRNIYNKFIKISKQANNFNQNKIGSFLKKFYLNYKTLKQAKNLKQQIQIIMRKQKTLNLKFIGDEVIQKCKRKIRGCENYQELVLSCLFSSFSANLCLYSQHPQIGYTLLCQRFPIKIYGTSNLTLQGIFPKWIVCHNLTENASGQVYCKIAHEVKQSFFQREIVQGQILQTFKISKLIKSNPFYIKRQYNVSTYIYIKVYEAYLNRKNITYLYPISDNIQILFSQSYSKITLFVYIDQQNEEQQVKNFQQFLDILKKHMGELQRYNYLGSSKILFNQNFQIYDIDFNIEEYIFDITHLDYNGFIIIYNNCYGYGKLEPISNDNIRIYLDQQRTAKILNDHLQQYKSYGYFQTKVIKTIKNHSNPHQQVTVCFFAGEPIDPFVRLTGYNQYNAKQNCDYLNQAIRKTKNDASFRFNVFQEIIAIFVSKSKDEIIIQTPLDEFNIEQILVHLIKKSYLNRNFIYPQGFFKQRKPKRPMSGFNNEQWKRQVHQRLSKYIKDQYVVFDISQFNWYRNSYSQNDRINICAKFIIQDNNTYKSLYEKLDNKRDILGYDRIHIKSNFSVLVCTVHLGIYQFYQWSIMKINSKYKSEGHSFSLNFSRGFHYGYQLVSIFISSPNKDDLFPVLKALKRLFVPRNIKLSQLQAQIMKNNFQDILREIRQNYYSQFIFNYEQRLVSAYCDDSYIQKIEKHLKKLLAFKDIKSQFVSYKGKNLNKVLEILLKFNHDYSKQEFFYEIVFKKWGINLTGKLKIIEQCTIKIKELNEQLNPQCQICQDVIRTPFKLHNCEHIFCWQCLAKLIRQYKNSNQIDKLNCPFVHKKQQCRKKINYFDAKLLFNEEEFREIQNSKIKSYIQSQDKYLMCKNCEQILDSKVMRKKQAGCNFCGSNRFQGNQGL